MSGTTSMRPLFRQPPLTRSLSLSEGERVVKPEEGDSVGFMLPLTVLFLALASSTVCVAQPLAIRSQSGQFVVSGLPPSAALVPNSSTSAVSYVRLEPAVLAVCLERIKQALLKELATPDEWGGPINVVLHPVRQDDEAAHVTSIHYADKWGYRIDLPERVDKQRLLRVATQVLLLEMANRRAGSRQAELPPWLAGGLLAHLRATSLASLTLEPQTSLVLAGTRRDPLLSVRECLRTNSPLTLNELNLPTEEQFSGKNAEVYENCAHLFVAELLGLKNGRACLREMLALLPDYLNWQTAFLRAFQDHFPRLLEVDKWWSLNLVSVTGGDSFSIWPPAQSWDKLQEILLVPIQVRAQTNDLPITAEARLQTMIAEWDYTQQAPVLRQKIAQLQAFCLRVMPELAGLADGYRQALGRYLEEGIRLGLEPARKNKPSLPPQWLVSEAQKRLDELDVQREFLRQKTAAAQTSAGH